LHEPRCASDFKNIDAAKFRLAEEQWTPTPWEAVKHPLGGSGVYVEGTQIHVVESCMDRDATLLAAAPELFRACRRALDALRPRGDDDGVVRELAAALTKAGGGEHGR
jgi:hypothetical protein